MDHQNILRDCFNKKNSSLQLQKPEYNSWVECISKSAHAQKGVYTVLVTLLVHKIFNPDQDIRNHQASMDGFSGRTIDKNHGSSEL